MQLAVESADACWDDFRKTWTLKVKLRSPLGQNEELTPSDFRQLRRWVRHPPRNEREAEFFASRLNEAIEREEPVVLDRESRAKGNIIVGGKRWGEAEERKAETKEERRMGKAVEKRKVEYKVSVEPGDLSHAQCVWILRRLARAMQLGIKPLDAEHMAVLIGVKKLRTETRKRRVKVRDEDTGVERFEEQPYEHPVFEELRALDGPDDSSIPGEEEESMPAGFAWDEEMKNVFSKGKASNGLPFSIMSIEESKIEVVFGSGIMVESAAPYVDHYLRMLPFITDPKGFTLPKELFGGG